MLSCLLLDRSVSSFLRGPLGCPSGLELQYPEFPEEKLFHRGSMIAQDDTQEIYKVGST